jgi:hypothetical protein
MSFPGFTAEVSLYKTSGHYELNTNVDALTDENALVYPQACSGGEWAVCAVKVAGCGTVCSLAWATWFQCMAGCLWLTGAAQCIRCM